MPILKRFGFEFDLKYAITEIVLIVIAILFAFAADEWWQEKADHRTESGYLFRLKDEISGDIAFVNFWISRMEEKRRFVEVLRIGAIDELMKQEGSELWESFNVSSLPCFPPLQSASYTELVSTGQLNLLRNSNLRQALANYYSIIKNASATSNRSAPREYNAIVLSRFPSDVAYNAAVLRNTEKAEISAGLKYLASDPGFPSAATAESNYAVACIESLNQTLDRAKNLNALLE